MISLFIDTCTSNLILAVCKDIKVVKKIVQKNDTNLSTDFTFIVDKLLNDCNIKIGDVQKIFVSIGPGSFTGIRIGLTFAKILAWSQSIPVIPVSSLEVLAAGVDCPVVVPILDARRGYVYAGVYNRNLSVIIEDGYIYLEDLKNRLRHYSNVIYVSCDSFDFSIILPNYAIENVIVKYYNSAGVNPHSLVPRYLKKTEAEEKLEVN